MTDQQIDRDHLRENAAEGGPWGAVVLALLDQLDLQEQELDSWMTRAYEAEGKLWKAEARIKAVRDVLDTYGYKGAFTGKEQCRTDLIRRALESVPPPSA